MVSTLNQLPVHMQSLADENPNMPSMSLSTQNSSDFWVLKNGLVTEPNTATAVFVRAMEDCGYITLPE